VSITGLRYNYVYATLLFLVFPFATLVLIESSRGASGLLRPNLLMCGLIITFFSAFRLIKFAKSCPDRMLATVFYVFSYIWLGLSPIYQLGIGKMPWHISLDSEIYFFSYLIIFLAIISFELGYLVRFKVGHVASISHEISRNRIVVLSFISLGLAIWFGPLTTSPLTLISHREEVAAAFGDGADRQVKIALMRTPIYVSFLMLLWKVRLVGFRDRTLLILLMLTFPVFLIVNFPTAISRAWLGAILISICLVIFLTSQKKRFRYFPILLPVGLLTIFPLLHKFRRSSTGMDEDVLETISSAYSRGDFDVFSMTAHFVNHLNQPDVNITYGNQLLGVIFFWVPRSLWSDKPVGSGFFVAERSGFQFSNVSAPFWAEGLINFGILGVFIFMFLFGLTLKMLDKRVGIDKALSTSSLLYVYFAGFLILIMRGDLMTVFVYSLPVYAWVMVAGIRLTSFSKIR
jgi:oligosaccharide repeat unit polymerase